MRSELAMLARVPALGAATVASTMVHRSCMRRALHRQSTHSAAYLTDTLSAVLVPACANAQAGAALAPRRLYARQTSAHGGGRRPYGRSAAVVTGDGFCLLFDAHAAAAAKVGDAALAAATRTLCRDDGASEAIATCATSQRTRRQRS